LLRPTTPCLAALYAAPPAKPLTPAPEDVFTIGVYGVVPETWMCQRGLMHGERNGRVDGAQVVDGVGQAEPRSRYPKREQLDVESGRG
jgi:hypothetical protein